jgi:hypothetical protein
MVAVNVAAWFIDNWDAVLGLAALFGGPTAYWAVRTQKAAKQAGKVADSLIKTIDEIPQANKAVMAIAKKAGLEEAVKEIDAKLVQPRKRMRKAKEVK